MPVLRLCFLLCHLGRSACAPRRAVMALALRCAVVALAPRCAVVALALLLCLAWPAQSRAAPSCQLTRWLSEMSIRSNALATTINSPEAVESARSLRRITDRYPTQNIKAQIAAAQIGTTAPQIEAYIAARLHVMRLFNSQWNAEAIRYVSDPRFAQQDMNLRAYLSQTACDPYAPDLLSVKPPAARGPVAVLKGAINDIESAFTPPPVDPLSFDLPAGPVKPRIELTPTGDAAFVLGVLTFISSTIIWIWMRFSIKRRRHMRYPCTMGVRLFDGAQDTAAKLIDLSQSGAKLGTSLALAVHRPVQLTIGTTKYKGRICWNTEHFSGMEFDEPLSQATMEQIFALAAAPQPASRDLPPPSGAPPRAIGIDVDSLEADWSSAPETQSSAA